MRIIAGTHRSRRLETLPGATTRPTLDRNRENMFNLLGGFFEGGVSLDCFGGSGALSLEALSRGIEHAFIIEKDIRAFRIIEANVASLGFQAQTTLLHQDVKDALKKFTKKKHAQTFDLVLLDPPFEMQVIEDLIGELEKLNLLNPGALIACEFERKYNYTREYKTIQLIKKQNYGISTIHIYQKDNS
jgi:16S rRNA (guanine(966)-N(2))-methyltransferase RsmD